MRSHQRGLSFLRPQLPTAGMILLELRLLRKVSTSNLRSQRVVRASPHHEAKLVCVFIWHLCAQEYLSEYCRCAVPLYSIKWRVVGFRIRLMRSLVTSTFLYACEPWTLTAKLQRRIQAMEMRCYRKILRISYKDHVTNEEVRAKIQQAVGPHEGF